MSSVEQMFVMVMPTNPEPNQAFGPFFSQRAIPQPDADRPEDADFLEVERWMARIGLKQLKF